MAILKSFYKESGETTSILKYFLSRHSRPSKNLSRIDFGEIIARLYCNCLVLHRLSLHHVLMFISKFLGSHGVNANFHKISM